MRKMKFFNIIISMAVMVLVKVTLAAPQFNDNYQVDRSQQRFSRKIVSDDYYNDFGAFNGIDRADLRPSDSPPKFKYRPIYQYKHTQSKHNRNHKLFVLNTWG